jgi:hypothetical protein|tara:strand:+ start:283 stop:609 length:327 start_codon:yes stop_codon:yes gene_type:complete
MNWATYNSKKSKVCEFKKLEEVVSEAKKEIKNADGDVTQAKTDEIKRDYIALVSKRYDSETGKSIDDFKQEFSLSQLENEKAKYDNDMANAKSMSDGIALAIADFKKL